MKEENGTRDGGDSPMHHHDDVVALARHQAAEAAGWCGGAGAGVGSNSEQPQ